MSDKQIRLCLGKHISWRCHLWRLGCRLQRGKTAVKKMFLFPSAHFCVRHEKPAQDRARPLMIWRLPGLQRMLKFPRGPWPLNVTRSFPSFVMSPLFITPSAQEGTPFVPQLLNVDSLWGWSVASEENCSQCKRLLNIESDNFCCRHMYIWLSSLYRSKRFKGPILYPFSCLCFSSCTIICTIGAASKHKKQPKKKPFAHLQKTAYFALYLQCLAKMLAFSYLLNPMLRCTFTSPGWLFWWVGD